MQRFMILVALAIVAEGCATAPMLRKQSFDFKTTALFKLPCDTPEVLEAKREIPDDGLETSDLAEILSQPSGQRFSVATFTSIRSSNDLVRRSDIAFGCPAISFVI